MPPEEEDTSTPAPVVEEPKTEDEPLGDGGKAALKAERARAAKAEKEAKAARDELARIQAENLSDNEKAIAAAKAEGITEATTAANKRVLRSEVKALAANKLNDANDAVLHLDLSEFTVDADGNVDEKAITAAIDELVIAKPYLAAKPAGPGSADGGVRTPAPDPSIDDAIAAATAAGDINESIRLKNLRAANRTK